MTNETPSYFYIDQTTFDAWVAALGFAAASKLCGACMTYFFHGELGDDVKLTKTAAALFEGERAKLDARRAKVAAKGATSKGKTAKTTKVTTKTTRGRVDKSVDNSRAAGKTEGKSPKNPSKKRVNPTPTTTETSAVPAQTSTKQVTHYKPKFYTPKPPRAEGERAGGSGTVSRAEFAALVAGGLGYATPGAYGMGERSRIVAGG